MGNTKSHFRKFSRRNSFSIILDRGMKTAGSGLPEKSATGIASRSHSLASNTTGSSDISRLSVPLEYSDSVSIKEPLPSLDINQLSLVKYSWNLVSVDTSNVCMNFFHQLQRQFTPRIKKSLNQKTAASKNQHNLVASAPSLHYSGNPQTASQIIISRNSRSCTRTTKTYIPQGQLTQQALKLACCLDAVIGSLTRSSKIKEEKTIEMLADNGHHFKTFLGLDSFYTDNVVVREMTNSFCESLRLVLIQNGLNWSQELQDAWDAIFRILLYHLDGLSQEDDDMIW